MGLVGEVFGGWWTGVEGLLRYERDADEVWARISRFGNRSGNYTLSGQESED